MIDALPYTIELPQESRIIVDVPELALGALVVLQRPIWRGGNYEMNAAGFKEPQVASICVMQAVRSGYLPYGILYPRH